MSATRGKIATSLGDVYWRSTPTKRDKVGCDGMFISRVTLNKHAKRLGRAVAERILQQKGRSV